MSSPSDDSGGGVARPPLLRDIDGTPISFHCAVEQVAVAEEHEQRGALFSELHQRGEVLGWDTHLLYVSRERDGQTVALRGVARRPPGIAGVLHRATPGAGQAVGRTTRGSDLAVSTTVNPQPYFDRLTAAVERLKATRSLSRQLHALAEEAHTLTNGQLADQLLALVDRARALP